MKTVNLTIKALFLKKKNGKQKLNQNFFDFYDFFYNGNMQINGDKL